MRVAALAFGVLAGLVASLILALGGLDVAANVGATADRQAQAIRFGLFLIGNLGMFGAALALAAPLAGAIFLVVGALAWVGAALLMHHSTDLVLIVPPALLLIAAILAVIAHFRGPRRVHTGEDDEDSDVEVIPPLNAERSSRPSEMMNDEDGVGIPAFAAEQRPASVRGTFDDDREAPQVDDWNPRRRQPPPPRTKPAFKPVEDEYEDDEEPSGLSRFALGLSSILSFGLYAALVGAGVLIFWSMRDNTEAPAAATLAEAPALSSKTDLAALPSSSEPPRLPSAEQTLEPILTGEPLKNVETTGTAPSTSPSELVAQTATSQQENSFGTVTMSDNGVPTLSDDFASAEESAPDADATLPPATEASAEPEASLEPAPAELDSPQPEPTVAASPDQPMPRSMPARMAAERTAPGTGPKAVAAPRTNVDNTGL